MTSISPEEQTATTGAFPAGLTHTAYAAFSVPSGLPDGDRGALASEVLSAIGGQDGVALRGTYDVSGYRQDADILFWLAAPGPDELQRTLSAIRRTQLGRALHPFWSAIGVHREAEFSKSHVPAYFAGEEPKKYVCAYPFVRTHDWYLLEPDVRRQLLMEHGMMGRDYADVRANTVSAFGLGDYEWLLAFEADDLTRIVDLIRHLRGAEARRYTSNELPFITGQRRPLADILADLP
ncbi:hydrogen peroxide-dependent heme synthase [Paraconexibacter sp.]|uniref:hydrogen peroxide-dependent heme synthase n=1 Tax=Paraconexibacter sp. TaxID=2949640 RepID=UPI00356504C5